MEINITAVFYSYRPHLYSASKAELGPDAGVITWANAMRDAEVFNLLNTEEKLEAFRAWLKSCGPWTAKETADFTVQELNALFLQFVAGDIRESGLLDTFEPDWDQYCEDASEGRVSGLLFVADDRQVYYTIC